MTDFDLGFHDLFEEGRRRLWSDGQRLVRMYCPEYFDLLERGGESDAYFEPFLHANAIESAAGFPHEQFLYGYVARQLRPTRVKVRADENGTVYLPRIGFFGTTTENRNRLLELRYDPASDQYDLRADESPLSWGFSPLDMIAGTPIQVYPFKHPFFRRYFDHHTLELGEVPPQYAVTEVEAPTRRFRNELEAGLKLIQRVDEALYDSILKSCRMVVLLDNPIVHSSACSSFLGAVFLSAPPEGGPIFFSEDLLHQVGHTSFFAITSNPFEHYTIPEQTRICEFTTLEKDKRTLDDAVHGVFTLARMAIFFDKCLDQGAVDGKQKHELLGRFALCMERYGISFAALADERLYTARGLEVYRRLRDVFEYLHAKRPELAGYDLSNQPYVFRYELFRQLNPLTTDAAIS